jgi:predicted MFS family arabinose efflux permease
VLLTQLAAGVGWRWAFALAGIPGLLAALLASRFIADRRSPRPERMATSRVGLAGALRVHNVRVSLVVSLLIGLWVSSVGAFVPQYLTTTKYHLSPQVVGLVVAAGGVGGFVGQLVMGTLSDRWGRRAIMLVGLAFLSLYAWSVPLIGPNVGPLAVALFVFSFGQVAVTLAIATIPPESAPGALAASAVAIPVFGIEAGSFLGPIVSGALADATRVAAMPLWLGGIGTAIALLVALAYRETVACR